MKTKVCDICGRREEDLVMYFDHKIYNFKQSFWNSNAPIRNFDICSVCLTKIKAASIREKPIQQHDGTNVKYIAVDECYKGEADVKGGSDD